MQTVLQQSEICSMSTVLEFAWYHAELIYSIYAADVYATTQISRLSCSTENFSISAEFCPAAYMQLEWLLMRTYDMSSVLQQTQYFQQHDVFTTVPSSIDTASILR